MEKVLNITNLSDHRTDFAYWSNKSFSERLAAIELLRRNYLSLIKDVQPRLQRVCTITHKA
jgi:hypothetical protein